MFPNDTLPLADEKTNQSVSKPKIMRRFGAKLKQVFRLKSASSEDPLMEEEKEKEKAKAKPYEEWVEYVEGPECQENHSDTEEVEEEEIMHKSIPRFEWTTEQCRAWIMAYLEENFVKIIPEELKGFKPIELWMLNRRVKTFQGTGAEMYYMRLREWRKLICHGPGTMMYQRTSQIRIFDPLR
jgi:hypothetical protein